uniref:NR LBD domain-containing protein n=1 Tax=Caenorhabditis tropicalis TaxID=1561998 RepID=A0A1I7URN4_9PELO
MLIPMDPMWYQPMCHQVKKISPAASHWFINHTAVGSGQIEWEQHFGKFYEGFHCNGSKIRHIKPELLFCNFFVKLLKSLKKMSLTDIILEVVFVKLFRKQRHLILCTLLPAPHHIKQVSFKLTSRLM